MVVCFVLSLCFLIHNQRNAIKGERSVFTWALKNNLEVKFTICWQTVNILEGKYKLSLQMTSPLIIPIGPNLPDDSSVGEIQNIELWASMNRMKLNLTKTGELVMRRKTRNPAWDHTYYWKKEWASIIGSNFSWESMQLGHSFS